jgi:ketosteroid isomerase-like protein
MSKRADRIREMFDAFNREGIEAALQHLTQDVVWHSFPEWPGQDKYEGWDGIRKLTEEWTENFDEYSWDVEEVDDRGAGVLLLGIHHGRSKGAGMPISQEVAGWFTGFDAQLRNNEARFFTSWEAAREFSDAAAAEA